MKKSFALRVNIGLTYRISLFDNPDVYQIDNMVEIVLKMVCNVFIDVNLKSKKNWICSRKKMKRPRFFYNNKGI